MLGSMRRRISLELKQRWDCLMLVLGHNVRMSLCCPALVHAQMEDHVCSSLFVQFLMCGFFSLIVDKVQEFAGFRI